MLFNSLSESRRRHRKQQRPARGRWFLRLEALEDRMVPSTLTVTSAADNGAAGTLRAVLAAAESGDTIQFAHSLQGRTIVLTQGQLTVNQSLNIAGPGASLLSISGNAASRIFDVTSGAVTIGGLTLTHGLAADGAGVLNAGTLTLSQDVLKANVAQGVAGGGLFGDGAGRGGAVENLAGATLTVSNSSFTNNEAAGGPNGGNAFGGAIYNEAGTVTITQGTFSGDQVVAANGGSGGVSLTLPDGISASLLGFGGGGAIWNDGGALVVASSAFSSNVDQGGNNGDGTQSTASTVLVGSVVGGAIGSGSFFTAATPSVTLTGSTMSGNQCQGGTGVVTDAVLYPGTDPNSSHGGAVGVVAGDLTIASSTVSGNLSEGGAMFTYLQGGNPRIVAGAQPFGGGIDDDYDFEFFATAPTNLNVRNSTISGNLALGNGPGASAYGGGVDTNLANSQLSNCTLSGNQALGGPSGGLNAFNYYSGLNDGGSGSGGGVFNAIGTVTITGSLVKGNVAQGGPGSGDVLAGFANGGGFNFANANISNTSFTSNLARAGMGGDGGFASGGAGTISGGALEMTGCSFTANQSIGGGSIGGALDVFIGSATIAGTSFNQNLALGIGGAPPPGIGGPTAFGGALSIDGDQFIPTPSTSLTNCTFVRNVAQCAGVQGFGSDSEGGGLWLELDTVNASNCTFLQNAATGGAGGQGSVSTGGGIDVEFQGVLQLSQSTLMGNEAVGATGTGGGAPMRWEAAFMSVISAPRRSPIRPSSATWLKGAQAVPERLVPPAPSAALGRAARWPLWIRQLR
jgi:fibronectin-binding autotransporter adhesin